MSAGTDARTDARAARVATERLLEADAPRLPPGFWDRVERFVALLLEANTRLNLTRVVEPDAVARLHLLDSLAALPFLDELEPRRALDLGTGGGVPGLVLAMARPDVAWTLVDSVRKKADAVSGFVDALRLTNVSVIAERAETLGQDASHRETHDLVAARACAPLAVLVEYALPLLAVNGQLLAWKGRMEPAELKAGTAAAHRLGGATPSIHALRHEALGDHRFVVVPKRRPTLAAYPRRPGEPSRRPLS